MTCEFEQRKFDFYRLYVFPWPGKHAKAEQFKAVASQ